MDNTITVEIHRSGYRPEGGVKADVYHVPGDHRYSILGLLNYIYDQLDPTVGFRHYMSYRGMCNTCRVRLNGKVVKTCISTVEPGAHLVLEPYNPRVIQDLATIIEGAPDPATG